MTKLSPADWIVLGAVGACLLLLILWGIGSLLARPPRRRYR